MADAITLKLASISFYSKGDERCLWRALKDIPFVSGLQCIDAGRSFSVATAMVDWGSFKDLMAIYIRYLPRGRSERMVRPPTKRLARPASLILSPRAVSPLPTANLAVAAAAGANGTRQPGHAPLNAVAVRTNLFEKRT